MERVQNSVPRNPSSSPNFTTSKLCCPTQSLKQSGPQFPHSSSENSAREYWLLVISQGNDKRQGTSHLPNIQVFENARRSHA